MILGGARSGKSDYGERLAHSLADDVLFVATAQADDEEMAARIARHRQRRPAHWRTVEAPYDLAKAIGSDPARVALVDCLTLLVSNLLVQMDGELDEEAAETAVAAEVDAILEAVQIADDRHVIIVSNEVGSGIVPDNRLARVYRDILGRANQRLAAAAQRVVLMVAGLPMVLKDAP